MAFHAVIQRRIGFEPAFFIFEGTTDEAVTQANSLEGLVLGDIEIRPIRKLEELRSLLREEKTQALARAL